MKKSSSSSPSYLLSPIALEQTEFNVYEWLLKLGESPVRKIVAVSGLKRPTVYNALYELEKRGLVKKVTKGKILSFRPESPINLLSIAQQRLADSERAFSYLNSLMPTLSSYFMLSTEQPVIRFFQGIEEVKKAYLYMLEGGENKTMYRYVTIDKKLDAPFSNFWRGYGKKRRNKNIAVKVIAVNTKEGRLYYEKSDKSLRTVRYIPLEKFPTKARVHILGDKVGFFTEKEGSYFATVIENKEIARTNKALFELAWEEAGRIDQKIA